MDALAEILLVDNEIIVLRSGNDCKFYISGPMEEVAIYTILFSLDFDLHSIMYRMN